MILLNEPWREYERRQRHARIKAGLVSLFTILQWLLAGIGLGVFLQYLLN